MEDVILPLIDHIGKPVGSLKHYYPILNNHKGIAGQMIERILGAQSTNSRLPDIEELGIEIKTIPILPNGEPLETTFVCKISLPFYETSYEKSFFYAKTRKILFVPLIGERGCALLNRKIGMPLLWQPSEKIDFILKSDWLALSFYLRLGLLFEIDSRLGDYLHIRPKATNSNQRTELIENNQIMTVGPIGFYLRKTLTREIIESNYAY